MKPLADRLQAARTSTGCLEWQRGTSTDGYGVVSWKGQTRQTHRLSFFLHHGWLPPVVRHSCDNPPCVAIEHLLAGTPADNVADAVARGRQVTPSHRGESHPQAKLTRAAVEEMRTLYAAGTWSHVTLGRKFGVDRSTIGLILRGDTWK